METGGQLKLNSFKKELVEIFVKYLKNVGLEMYLEALSGIANKKSVEKLKFLTEQSMKTSFVSTLAEVFGEINLRDAWDLLLNLKLSSENNMAWRPPGNVENHMRSVRINLKLKLIQRIECLISIFDLRIKNISECLEELDESTQFAVALMSSIQSTKDDYIQKHLKDFEFLDLESKLKL